MKRNTFSLILLSVLMGLCGVLAAQDDADSIDIIHTSLNLDLGRINPRAIRGDAEIQFVQTKPCNHFVFDMVCDSLYMVTLDGIEVSANPFNDLYDNSSETITIPANEGSLNDTHILRICYVVYSSYRNGMNNPLHSCTDGGLIITSNVIFTLGEDRQSNLSLSVGRAWHPCRDNWHDKSTYSLTTTSRPGWHCSCSGALVNEYQNDDGSFTSQWELSQPAASYQVGIWASNSRSIQRTVQGINRTYPLVINLHNNDSYYSFVSDTNAVKAAFECIDTVLCTFERKFSPYGWNRIGFVSTDDWCGMEHIDNITLGSYTITHENTIIHEFAHQWFGNLITAADEQSMWFNEGGGTFAEEVAYEALYGKNYSDDYYMNNLTNYLLGSRVSNTVLTNQSHSNIMGYDTYYKGALVWHMIRGYMGDSLFYSSMQQLFRDYRYGSMNAPLLLEKLSQYSNLDLTGLFEVMLYSKSYVDYQLESAQFNNCSATISLTQNLTRSNELFINSRVPITFFSADRRQMAERVMTFSSKRSTQTFDLPFTPAFVVVDYHRELSDAVSDDSLSLTGQGTTMLKYAFAKVSTNGHCTEPNAWIHIAHHFTQPSGELREGILRLSNRFWQVSGNIPWDPEVTGHFLYNWQGNESFSGDESVFASFDNIGYLDYNFYNKINLLDSMALVYRADVSQPWSVVSTATAPGSAFLSGYFSARLFPGQYALAVIDAGRVTIPTTPISHPESITLAPNPATDFISIKSIPEGTNVRIYNMQGNLVMETRYEQSGINIKRLPQGIYVVSTPFGNARLVKVTTTNSSKQ